MWSTLKRIERTHKNGMTWHPLEWTNCLNGIYVSAACNWGKLAEELKGDTSEQPKKKKKSVRKVKVGRIEVERELDIRLRHLISKINRKQLPGSLRWEVTQSILYPVKPWYNNYRIRKSLNFKSRGKSLYNNQVNQNRLF